MRTTLYKFSKSILPMVLLTLSVGWCYAWSMFSVPIAEHMAMSKITVQLTFCLNILLLGLGAAFFGNLVERRIKFASLLSTVLLTSGFLLTAAGLHWHYMSLIYIGSGVCCGLAQGIAYVISPKNLLLWWSKTKYKATVMSLSIICFGLGSSLCAVLFNQIYPKFGIENTFLILCGIYTTMMLSATAIINKPKYALNKIKHTLKFNYTDTLMQPTFWKLWTFMFLNISAGLILIGNCAPILNSTGLSTAMITTVMFICGLSNGFGRLVFPVVADFMKNKVAICLIILGIEICLVSPTIFMCSAIPLMIVLCNATYGAAFACLPSLVSYKFGNTYLTTIHGLVLSAWGIASVFAYICSTVLQCYGIGYVGMLICILLMYMANFANSLTIDSKKYISHGI